MRWRDRLSWIKWPLVLGLFAAAMVGAAGIIVATEVNRHTSTVAFCSTSCHSMTPITADPHYQQSAHISNSSGVSPSCGGCHVPTTNFFVETYVHVKSGICDVIAEITTNFDDKQAWEARRIELAKGVRETMRSERNVTCKSCHTPANIKPTSQTGQMIHASLQGDQMACVSCHRNLVHSRPGARSSADEIAAIKRAMENTVHSSGLANRHVQKGFTCQTCHGNDLIPDANATAVVAQCRTCHGGTEQVAQTYKGPKDLNPHASLGDVACSSCHKGHQ